jgi:plastocyanin
MAPEGRFSYAFDRPGTYFFFCTPHDWMIGQVEVTGEGAVEEPPGPPAAQAITPLATDVAVSGYEFLLSSVAVASGGAVTWINFDADQHSATAIDGSWSTSRLSGGQSDTLVFMEVGVYGYQCSIHPSMQGEVVVTP